MRKIITLFIFLPFYFLSFSYTQKDLDSALTNLYREILFSQPQSYAIENYAELAYLKRIFNLSKVNINDSSYKSKILNNYYYDQFYLFSKFLNENAIVTEDCLNIPESTEEIHKANKLLYYSLYPNSIKLPSNIIEQIEEYSTIHEFYGPYQMLNIIYYLKKYNYSNLTQLQKDKLATLQTHFEKLIFNKYVKDKNWNFYKLLSVKVLKMNKSDLVKDLDITVLIDYFKAKHPLEVVQEDKTQQILGIVGAKKIIEQQANAILWIFLLEIK